MISMTDKEFIYKFDKNIDFSYEQSKAICLGYIGENHKVKVNDFGDCIRIFQVNGRWFRVHWFQCLYLWAELCEMQSRYDYIHSLNIHDLAEYLRNFGAYYKPRDDGISLNEIKAMLAEYKEAF